VSGFFSGSSQCIDSASIYFIMYPRSRILPRRRVKGDCAGAHSSRQQPGRPTTPWPWRQLRAMKKRTAGLDADDWGPAAGAGAGAGERIMARSCRHGSLARHAPGPPPGLSLPAAAPLTVAARLHGCTGPRRPGQYYAAADH
jgi:hypothetical protein